MAFPQTALPVSLLIAPGANPADASTYAYVDITSDVRYADGIQIQAGRQDEGSRADTTAHRVTLDNRAGNYSARNPLGTWYGQLRKGTPVQTRVMLVDDLFARTVASGLGTDPTTGYAWSTTGGYSVNGTNGLATFASANLASTATLPTVCGDDVDVVKVTSCSAVATGAAWVDATLIRYQDANNYYRVHTEYAVGGLIAVKVSRTSGGSVADIFPTASTSVAYSAGTKIRTRVQAIGPTIRIKVWLDSGSEPAAWTASVNDTSTTVRGNSVGLLEWRVVGNTNAGSMSVSIYEFRCDAIRATTPVPEWSPRWNRTGSYPTTPIQGAGTLRRLSQGQSALRSPMYRGLLAQKPAGFWPLEDGTDATQASSALSGGVPARINDVTFAAAGPPGAESAITTNTFTSVIQGSTSLGSDTVDGYACLVLVKFGALPGSSAPIIQWQATGTVVNWIVTGDSTSFAITGTDNSGSTVVSSGGVLYGLDPTKWWAMQLETNVSGGTVNWALDITQVGSGSFGAVVGSYSGTAKKAIGFKAGGMANISYSMSWLGDNDLSFVSGSFVALASGFAGETAGARVQRLAAEEGVPMVVMGDPSITAQMGVQAAATFIDLIRECEDAEQALVIERGAGLGFLTYDWRTNVPVQMALDFNAGHVADPPEPTDDDLNLINVVKLTRKGGSEVTAQNAASVALSGAYIDEKTVNVYLDSQLPDQAGWRLHMGTLDELRWPRITLQLHANPSLIPTWCAMRIGSRITVANPPAAVAGGSLDLIVEGYNETISLFAWDVEINCSPAAPWDVGVYDASTTRYDSANTTLASGISSGATSVPITTAFSYPADTWSTTGVPYTWVLAGEQMTVTAMTAPVGTGPWTQTATVTRAVNGIVKAHSTGETVILAAPARYAI